MNLKSAGILLTVLLVLVGVAYWDDFQTKKDEEQAKLEKSLVAFDPEEIEKIEFKAIADDKSEAEDLEIVRSPEGWQLNRPVKGKADVDVVENFLTTIREYEFDRVVSSDEGSWSNFGLKPAKRVIKLYGSDIDIEVYVGDKSPVGYGVFSRLGDKPDVYVGSQYLLVATSKKLFDFRDKSLLNIVSGDLKRFKYTKGNQAIEFKRDQDRLDLVQPMVAKADQIELEDFFSSLSNLKVISFIDQPEGRIIELLSPDKAQIKMEWDNGSETPSSLAISKDGDEVLAITSMFKKPVRLKKEDWSKVSRNLDQFRDRRVFRFDTTLVREVSINGVVYKFIDGDWYAETVAQSLTNKKVEDKPEPSNSVRSLLADLEFLKAEEFLPLDASVAEVKRNPDFSIEMSTGSQEVSKADLEKFPAKINIWKNKGSEADGYYLRHSLGKHTYVVLISSIKDLEEPETLDASAQEQTPSGKTN